MSPPKSDPAPVAAPGGGGSESAAGAGSNASTDKLGKAMEGYDRILQKFGNNHDAANSFLSAYSKGSSLLGGESEERKEGASKTGSERGKELLKEQKHDMEFSDRSKYDLGLPVRPPGYGATYLGENWEMNTIDTADNPAELTDEAWSILVRSNKILHGYVIQKNGSMSRARFPAFKFKNADGKDSDGIPHYEIFDDSSITIKESSRSIENSMVSNGFSSNAIEASVSGGFGGISAAASGAYKDEHQQGQSQSVAEESKQYTACYSFPRARIFADELDLDLSPDCEAAIKKVVEAVQHFPKNVDPNPDMVGTALYYRERLFARYGHVFATNFLLGGQLTATKSASSLGKTSASANRDAMKWSAAVSFDSKFVNASVSGGQEQSSNTSTSNSSVVNNAALAWSARGGNTLLAANPAEWANSVGGFRTWRPLEQDGVSGLVELVAKLTDKSDNMPWQGIPESFKTLKMHENTGKLVSSIPSGPTPWTGKFKLQHPDGRWVKWDGTKILFSEGTSGSEATTFRALDASWDARGLSNPKMDKFLAEWPLFLPTAGQGDDFARSESYRLQIPGLWVGGDGDLCREVNLTNDKETPNTYRKICRWSFRLKENGDNFRDTYNPNSRTEIVDGAQVTMHCHSYFCGSYVFVNNPPYFAPAVYGKPGSSDLKVIRSSVDHFGNMKCPYTPPGINFQFFAPNEQLGFLFKPPENLQRDMDQFDRLEAPGDPSKPDTASGRLETFRKLYAVQNKDVARGFFASTLPRTTTTPNAVFQDPQYANAISNDDSFYNVFYRDNVAKAVIDGFDAWRGKTGLTDKMVFVVRYVR